MALVTVTINLFLHRRGRPIKRFLDCLLRFSQNLRARGFNSILVHTKHCDTVTQSAVCACGILLQELVRQDVGVTAVVQVDIALQNQSRSTTVEELAC